MESLAQRLAKLKFADFNILLAFEQQGFSLAQAAAATGLSVSSVSMRISALEEGLGIRLLLREKNRYTGFTPEGRQVMEHVRRISWELARIGELTAPEHARRETLTIATSHSIARYCLPPVVRRFMQRYPQASITIEQQPYEQVAALVESGGADIGLLNLWTPHPETPGVAYIPYGACERIGIAPAGCPLARQANITLSDLAAYNIISYRQTSQTSIAAAFLSKMARRASGSVRCGNADVVKALVEQGSGISVLPEFVYDSERDKGIVTFDVSHLFPRTTFYCVLKKNVRPKHSLYDLIALLAPEVPPDVVDGMVML